MPPFWLRFGVNNIIYIIGFQNQILIIQFFLLYQLIKIHIIKHKENFTIGFLIFVLLKASTSTLAMQSLVQIFSYTI